ncbi:hypothetical protein NMY22_g1681 [Coprinellus aureogranulatus]|nr:hypothetical protein NMY22_g1681 [Coprinellus aureogranulatus]
MASACVIPPNPDISGIGVRTSIYAQTALSMIPAIMSIRDGEVCQGEMELMDDLTTSNLALGFAMVVTCFVQALTLIGLTSYHAYIILCMGWLANSNAFIHFQLYILHKKGKRRGKLKFDSWVKLGLHKLKQETRFNMSSATNVMGSVHLTLMSGLGIWLWSAPGRFGTLDAASHCAVQHAELMFLGNPVPFRSNALRIIFLIIYSVCLFPGFNILIPANISRKTYKYLNSRRSRTSRMNDLPESFSAWLGLAVILFIDTVLIVDIELALRRNRALQLNEDEAQWGFGQTLAMVVLAIPLWDFMNIRRLKKSWQRRQVQANSLMRSAVERKDIQGISDSLGLGADVEKLEMGDRPNKEETGDKPDKEETGAKLDGEETGATPGKEGKLIALEIVCKHEDSEDSEDSDWATEKWGLVCKLIYAGVDVNKGFSPDDEGSGAGHTSALHAACKAHHYKAVYELLDHGADAEKPVEGELTPLQLLEEEECRPTLQGFEGEKVQTPEQVREHRKVCELLRGHLRRSRDNQGQGQV